MQKHELGRLALRRAMLWVMPMTVLMGLGYQGTRLLKVARLEPALGVVESKAEALAAGHSQTARVAAPPHRDYGQLPLSFESNQGQVDSAVKFISRGSGYSLFLTPTEAVLALRKGGATGGASGGAGQRQASGPTAVLRTRLAGANAAPRITGQQMLSGKSNYFIGNDPAQWRTNVAQYAKVQYDGVYPGVDLVYYGNQRQLEYDFVVAPGANPRAIKFGIEGARRASISAMGDLVLDTGSGQVMQHAPVAYQIVNGTRKPVASRYELEATHQTSLTHTVGFRLAAYDTRRPLVIDPVLAYSAYLGGSGSDSGNGIAVDGSGNAYIVGTTASTNFPGTSAGSFQQTNAGGSNDAFVSKLNSTGTAIVYTTYLGGNGNDQGKAIAVDTAGNAYLTGQTDSTNFPTQTPIQASLSGIADAFVTKLNSTGSALNYSTYLGPGDPDTGNGIAVDNSGSAYVVGSDSAGSFSNLVPGSYRAGTFAVFVVKFAVNGQSLVYASSFGGSSTDDGQGIAVDGNGEACITGHTFSSSFPTTVGAVQTANAGNDDAFVVKLSADGTAPVYSTYLGGSGHENNRHSGGIAVDASGNAYVTGTTDSANYPKVNPIQTTVDTTFGDVFVTKINAAGSALMYSTPLGGSVSDEGHAIAVDASGDAYITGSAQPGFPTVNASQSNFGGFNDAFAAELNPAGTALVYSTFLGGSNTDTGNGIAVDSNGDAYVTGTTSSTDFPTTPGALQTAPGGSNDAFITKFHQVPAALTLSVPSPITEGQTVNGTVSRNTDTSGPLTVNLSSDTPSRLTVPAQVVIPAGQASTTFAVTAVDNTAIDGNANVVITATAGGLADGTANVTVQDNDGPTLFVSITTNPATNPATFSEAAGPNAATGTVTRNTGTTGDLVVNLSSSDTNELTVPATVTIPNGQDHVDFTIAAVDNNVATGDQQVTITATAPGYNNGVATATVTDNDVATITLTVATNPPTNPVTFNEGAGPNAATGTVTRNTPTNVPLTVNLGATDIRRVSLPPSVVIPAGQNSASFTIGAVDDAIAQGTQTIFITAGVPGFVTGNAPVIITDNDTPTLGLLISTNPATNPVTISETAGANAATGTVVRNTPFGTSADSPVTVSLVSSNPSVVVPAQVVIPASQASVTFTIGVIDDNIAQGTRRATISATSTGFVAATASLLVTDNESPTLAVTFNTFGVTELDGPGAATGTVTRNTPTDAPLTVALSSANPGRATLRATVPATVTIPAGAASATFTIDTAPDATTDYATQGVVITASAPSFTAGTATLPVSDVTVTLKLSASTIFSAGQFNATSGTISLSQMVKVPVTVALTSSNPAVATVPASVTIPANTPGGASSGATFQVSAVPLSVPGPSQQVTITATVANLTPATATLTAINSNVAECDPQTIPLNHALGFSGQLQVPATTDYWVTLQPKENAQLQLRASLSLNGQVVVQNTIRTAGFHGTNADPILHLKNPAPGAYMLSLQADRDADIVVRSCTDLPVLALNQPLTRTLWHNDAYDWLQMDVSGGVQQISFVMESVGNGDRVEVFRDDFSGNPVASGVQLFDPPLKFTLDKPAPGRYLVRVLDAGDIAADNHGSQIREYTLTATATFATDPPRPAGITPNRGGNTGSTTATITGSNLDPAATVKLTKAGVPDIPGSGTLGSSDNTSLETTFDLTGKAPGVYNVVVTNQDGKVFQLPNAFTVEEGGKPDLWLNLMGRTVIRAGRPSTFTVQVGNRGSVDAYFVPLFINGIPKDAQVKLDFDLSPVPDLSGHGIDTSQIPPVVPTATDQMIPLILPVVPAGSSGNLMVTVTVPQGPPFVIDAFLIAPLVDKLPTSADRVAFSKAVHGNGPRGIPDIPGLPKLSQCQKDLLGVGFAALGLLPGAKCVGDSATVLAQFTAFSFTGVISDANRVRRERQGASTFAIISFSQYNVACLKLVADCAGSALPGVGQLLGAVGTGLAIGRAADSCGSHVAHSSMSSSTASAVDPNDKVGPAGVGPQHYITGHQPIGYTIFFENKPTATAPASQVIVTDQLDVSKFDLNSMSLGPVTFGDTVLTPPSGLSDWTTRIDLRPAKSILVQVSGKLDKTTGVITWVFTSLEPDTLLPPEDPSLGFLPADKIPGQGAGSVSFTITPKALPNNAVIRNGARIVFDANAHIDTPVWSNTIEGSIPRSHVLPLAAKQNTATFKVSWTGNDQDTGVQTYTVYASENGGPFTPFVSNTTDKSALFTGTGGKTYRFYSIATDQVGNVESPKTRAEATTTLSSVDLALTAGTVPAAVRVHDVLTYSLTVTNRGPQDATGVVLKDTLPAGVTFGTAHSSRGATAQARGVVTVNIGALAHGASATIMISVTPTAGGPLNNTATVAGNEPDPNGNNNSVSTTVTAAPYVTFTAPVDGASINALPQVTGTFVAVPGHGGVSRVDLFIQRQSDNKFWTGSAWGAKTALATTISGTNWSRRDTTATRLPNLANLPEGTYIFTATAVDRSGDTATATANVTVDRTQPASVMIVRPANGSLVNNLLLVTGTATDNARGGGIGQVQLFIQRQSDHKFWTGTTWGAKTRLPTDLVATSAAVVQRWTTSSGLPSGAILTNGQYTLTATAIDRAGNSRASAASTVTVDKTAPTVSITSPADQSVVSKLAAITGRAADERGGSGLLRVDVFLQRLSDGKFWTGRAWGVRTALTTTVAGGAWTRSTGLPASTNLDNGDYSVQAVATDKAGNHASALNTVTVSPIATGSAASSLVLRSGVVPSMVTVNAATSSITLRFGGALNADVAGDASHYAMQVNRKTLTVESAAYDTAKNAVTLALPAGSLHTGDRVVISWRDVLDVSGRTLTGDVGPISAQ